MWTKGQITVITTTPHPVWVLHLGGLGWSRHR